jgi:hypothetical protein
MVALAVGRGRLHAPLERRAPWAVLGNRPEFGAFVQQAKIRANGHMNKPRTHRKGARVVNSAAEAPLLMLGLGGA